MAVPTKVPKVLETLVTTSAPLPLELKVTPVSRPVGETSMVTSSAFICPGSTSRT